MTNKSKKISVFISSTYEDLANHRKAVWQRVIDELPVEIRGMETFGARSEKPIEVCLEEVSQSDVYVGIIGTRYGSVEKSMGRSFVELEYSKAVECKLPKLIYLIDEDEATVHPRDMDCENGILLNLFKQRLKTNHKYEQFISEQDLSVKVASDVGRTLREKGLLPESNSRGYIVASVNSGVITRGDQIRVEGKTTEKPKSVGLWLFHDNYFLHRYIYVYPGGSFSDSLPTDVLNFLPAGQYYVLVQHPSGDNSFNVLPVHESERIKVVSTANDVAFNLTGEDSLKGNDAFVAILNMLKDPAIDDLYVRLTFTLEEPWIRVDALPEIRQGDTITITGTTNLSPDNALAVQLLPVFLGGESLGDYEVILGDYVSIIGDEPYNRWSFELDTNPMREGTYWLLANSLRHSGPKVGATEKFSVLKSS